MKLEQVRRKMEATGEDIKPIGGYVIVAHRTISGHYADDRVTHAFKDLEAAKKEARDRTEKIENTHQDYEGGHIEYRPTIHAVSPKLFGKVEEHLSREEYPGQSSFCSI